ncbi:MAG: hypothetical protein WD993_05045 [Thermoleophilaceae bacterium]
MAYVTPRRNGTWELRESVSTPQGPRSRTLVSFRTLSEAAIETACSRAAKPLAADEIRDAARRAGAPVDLAAADQAAGDLLRELDAGREPHPILRQLLVEALQAAPPVRLGNARRGGAIPLRPQTGRDAPSRPRSGGESHAGGGVTPLESLDNARASAAWLTATPEERGKALYDLLLLGERLQQGRPEAPRKPFPRLDRAA